LRNILLFFFFFFEYNSLCIYALSTIMNKEDNKDMKSHINLFSLHFFYGNITEQLHYLKNVQKLYVG